MATAGKKPTAIISVSIIHDMVLPYPAAWRSAPPMIPPAARSVETAVMAGRLLGSGSGGSVSSNVSVLSWETALTETGTIKQAQTAMAPAIAIRNGMFCTGQCRTDGIHGNREISCARVEKFAQWRPPSRSNRAGTYSAFARFRTHLQGVSGHLVVDFTVLAGISAPVSSAPGVWYVGALNSLIETTEPGGAGIGQHGPPRSIRNAWHDDVGTERKRGRRSTLPR